ncbi:M16 family metallopeptidase [Arcticibacterium luteifluviistationis]|uniref:Peptidase M16 n=1 Tax=Arcticibacterium luteifluviistationis TaxID=1784714 RepID=A0A2Z4G834_9BACT|nr:pitrilysin family protein [Arcticibacterium luteifluviistationis]AWV97359.1 peptidase M16 [Arcticibacterium luteifluviistationis]
MISYQHFALKNGLQVYLHEDKTTPIAAFNIVYNVGSRDEDESRTGFAHLFEHLMFGGSKNIPSYDEPLQKVGGENNAFTSPDVTNYYITLPVSNIETAFWLESDRMLSLSFDPKVLEVQRKVVIEEFKQRYLSQPYGDVWLKMRPLAYKNHPYKWATIGKEIKHIEDATLEDVKDFFFTHYRPNNATLVVAGNISLEEVKRLTEKWFGDIPAGPKKERKLPLEPVQTEARFLETEAKVPLSALYKAYHMPGRYEEDFHKADLISDVLGRGKSSRLYKELVKEQGLFNNINAYISSSLDPGLLMISGNLNEGISIEKGNEAVEKIVLKLTEEIMEETELEKVKNQAEASIQFSEIELLTRAMNLAFAANYGDPELCNKDAEKLAAITPENFQEMAKKVLRPENCSTMFYRAVN